MGLTTRLAVAGERVLQPRSHVNVGLAGITTEQWHNLLDLLNVPKPKDHLNGGSLSILDTGATHHVTSMFSHFTSAQKINGCMVGLQDGSSTEATDEGDVVLPGNLRINNVLFVPSLDCNLIYVM